jgi:hypothetical protein
MCKVKLFETPKYKKYQLADIAGYKVKEIDKETGRCMIIGADNYIDNDFPNIDAVLLLISNELARKGFSIVAA